MPQLPENNSNKPPKEELRTSPLFIPAERFKQKQSVHALRKIAELSIQAANQERVAALDGEGNVCASFIKRKETIAAAAQTEIILRGIFS